MHHKHRSIHTPATSTLTTKSCDQLRPSACLIACCKGQLPSGTPCSANISFSVRTKCCHTVCHQPAPGVQQQAGKPLAAGAACTARGETAALLWLPAPWLPHLRVRGVPPDSRGATAVQEGQWCGTCQCAQGLLFHFHLSHPISTAVCHQRREN